MNRTFHFGFLVAILAPASISQGAVLFERELEIGRSPNNFSTDQFALNFTFSNSFFTPTNPVTLFSDLTISPSHVGQTFVASASTDAAFADAVVRLTDSLNQNIRMLFAEKGGLHSQSHGFSESSFLLGQGAPDLVGKTIQSIALRVDKFTLDFTTTSSSTAVSSPPVDLLLTFTVIGTVVPEPGSLKLASGGLAIACCAAYTVARRRRSALAYCRAGGGRLRPAQRG